MYRKHSHEEQNVQLATMIQDREVLRDDCNVSSASRPIRENVEHEYPYGEAEDSASSRRGSPSFMASKRQRRRDCGVEDENDRMLVEPLYPSGSLVSTSVEADTATSNDPDEILVQMIQQFANSHPDQGGLSSPGEGLSYAQVVEFCRSSGIPLSRMLRLDLLGLCNPQSSAARVLPPSGAAAALHDPSWNPQGRL
jgi:hypothetical protein